MPRPDGISPCVTVAAVSGSSRAGQVRLRGVRTTRRPGSCPAVRCTSASRAVARRRSRVEGGVDRGGQRIDPRVFVGHRGEHGLGAVAMGTAGRLVQRASLAGRAGPPLPDNQVGPRGNIGTRSAASLIGRPAAATCSTLRARRLSRPKPSESRAALAVNAMVTPAGQGERPAESEHDQGEHRAGPDSGIVPVKASATGDASAGGRDSRCVVCAGVARRPGRRADRSVAAAGAHFRAWACACGATRFVRLLSGGSRRNARGWGALVREHRGEGGRDGGGRSQQPAGEHSQDHGEPPQPRAGLSRCALAARGGGRPGHGGVVSGHRNRVPLLAGFCAGAARRDRCLAPGGAGVPVTRVRGWFSRR